MNDQGEYYIRPYNTEIDRHMFDGGPVLEWPRAVIKYKPPSKQTIREFRLVG